MKTLEAMFRCRSFRERLVSWGIAIALSFPLMIPVVAMHLEHTWWSYLPVVASVLASLYFTRNPKAK